MTISFFQFEFIQNALLAGTVIAIIAPLVGNFLLIRRYALLADTLAHISLIGIALALIFGFAPLFFALVVAVLAALLMDFLRERQQLAGDTVLSLFLTGGVAVSVLLLSLTNNYNASFLEYLFGSIATISRADAYWIMLFGLLVLGTVFVLYRGLFFVSFDEEVAKIAGVPVRLLQSVLIAAAAISIVISARIVGVLLIGALSVIPPITAMRFSRSFKQTILYSILLSLLSVWIGIGVSYVVGSSSGATIVSVSLVLFLLSFVIPRARFA